MIADLARDVDEICARLPRYAASSGNFLPTFRISLSVQSSRVETSKNDFLDFLAIEDVTDCPETSTKNYHSASRDVREERRFLQI